MKGFPPFRTSRRLRTSLHPPLAARRPPPHHLLRLHHHLRTSLHSSARWRRRSVALASSVFPPLHGLRLLVGSSRVLCLAAGAGHAVDALHAEGVRHVTRIDLVDFPPLVRRADPHHLPFSDGSFDLVFSNDPAGVSGALFPSRIAADAERTVRVGGAIALAVDRHLDPAAVATLFKRSRIVLLRDVTLDGSQVRMLIF
ncbi:hypothetical protein GUJ93_ZPchr0015g6724 [Zizania palustris]|uniref:Methyltransferase type 11 domain-containing protein n=1 Tax=Zizania palustris TaxID=103762 RepID=A0A8J5SYJ1_ZIZPA|nr:hypothetical protein GUJ93_ZPchr0015g6724 [Zizania palustris]